MYAIVPPASHLNENFETFLEYLIDGRTRSRPSPNRVAWFETYNIAGMTIEDRGVIQYLLDLYRRRSTRTIKPAYHLIITWAPHEWPTPEQQHTIAIETMELAGLKDYLAVFVGHGDSPERHVHLLINRVHPDTGKAWSASRDYLMLDSIMTKLAKKHGFERNQPAKRPVHFTDVPPRYGR